MDLVGRYRLRHRREILLNVRIFFMTIRNEILTWYSQMKNLYIVVGRRKAEGDCLSSKFRGPPHQLRRQLSTQMLYLSNTRTWG